MLKPRIIPCLLLKNGGVEKTIRFERPTYIGCPTNAARVFSAKGVDELIVVDIAATPEGKGPELEIIAQIADECTMPLTAGGGVRTLLDVENLLKAGADKVVVNTHAVEKPSFLAEAAKVFGSQCMVASIDARRKSAGTYEVFTHGGRRGMGISPREAALRMRDHGAGEIFLNSIDRDGTGLGYDLELIRTVSDSVDIPIIACGGGGSTSDLAAAIDRGGASAAAAGSLFLFYGPRRTVLITYPSVAERQSVLGTDGVRLNG